MKDNHNFSETYEKRKQAVRAALKEESAKEKQSTSLSIPSISGKVLLSAALVSLLAVGTLAAASRFVDFRMDRDGNKVHIHAGIPSSPASTTSAVEDKPLRSWIAEDGEISIRLNIPDLPSDMAEDKTANGKYHGADSSRSMTINGIDLRRSDLNQLIDGASEVKQLAAGEKVVHVVEKGEADIYRIAYIVFEEDELVLKLWVSWGITDDELTAMASTLTLEETDDITLALPIQNEVNGTETDMGQPNVYICPDDPIYEADLIEIGESARLDTDWFTVTVNDVSVYDNISPLNPSCILQADKLMKFTDVNGNFVPYNRTPVIWGENGKQFGESEVVTKKLYVVTLTTSELDLSEFEEEDRYPMLRASVNGFTLSGYTVTDGMLSMISRSAVIDRTPGEYAMSSEIIYREDLGNGRWKVAYLIDDDIAEVNLVLGSYTGKFYIKLQ